MTPEEATQIADEVLIAYTDKGLTGIQRMILEESVRGKRYESMGSDYAPQNYAPQHIKNEGKKLWDLLSEALGEKVSKTNFQGALEKWQKLDETELKPPVLLTYNQENWVGREDIISDLLPKLQENVRLTLITGIAGIGKSALGECLAARAWEDDPSFQWVYLEILEGKTDFCPVVSELLAKLGDVDLDPKLENDPERLGKRLLQKLKSDNYWIQIDSLELLIDSDKSTETRFKDSAWINFFQHFLTESELTSRLVLTSQALPTALDELASRYSNIFQIISLKGLEHSQTIDLFTKYGLIKDKNNSFYLELIGKFYEGHPLVLKVITREILTSPFNGNVELYWQRYGDEFEEVARELENEHLRPSLHNRLLQKQVYQRVEMSLKRLPPEAFELLRCSSVYRRPVPETFWLDIVKKSSSAEQEKATYEEQETAYQLLEDRGLVEKSGFYQNQFLIRQHNLIRAVAYDLLKNEANTWREAELQAANLWLKDYKPDTNISNLEKLRGYLEGFYHYCEAEAWNEAGKLLFVEKASVDNTAQYTLRWQLEIWSYYREEVIYCKKLLGKCKDDINLKCWQGIGDGYLGLSNFLEAINSYKQSLELAQRIQVEQREIYALNGEIYALNGLGNAYYHQGKYDDAIKSYKEVLRMIKEHLGDPQVEGDALGNLGCVYNKQSHHKEAKKYHVKHLEHADEYNNRRGQIRALGNLGITHFYLEEYEEALEILMRCTDKIQKGENRSEESNILRIIGMINNIHGEYDKAIIYIEKSRDISKEIGDRSGEANALTSLANALYHVWGSIKAKELYEQAVKILEEIGDRQGEGNVLISLGDMCKTEGKYYDKAPKKKQKKYEDAINFYERSLGIAEEIGDYLGKGIAYLHIGITQIEMEKYAESLENLHLALNIFKRIDNKANQVEVLMNLAKLHHTQGQDEEARQYCEQALNPAKDLGIALIPKWELLLNELSFIP